MYVVGCNLTLGRCPKGTALRIRRSPLDRLAILRCTKATPLAPATQSNRPKRKHQRKQELEKCCTDMLLICRLSHLYSMFIYYYNIYRMIIRYYECIIDCIQQCSARASCSQFSTKPKPLLKESLAWPTPK